MKRFLVLGTLVALSAAMSAQAMPMMVGGPLGDRPSHFKLLGDYEKGEYAALRAELANKPIGELTGSELQALADRISIAERKDAWLLRSMRASMMFPGAGQFLNGDRLGGSLFAAAHVATIAGAAVAWYYLLPSNLKFDQLDYLGSPLSQIKARWEGNSLRDYLPAAGAMIGGMALDMLWRLASGHGALLEAKDGIDSGKIAFQPLDRFGGLGIRLRL